MGNLNIGEIGQPIRINLNEDISLATPTLLLQSKTGELKEVTDGVTIPAVDVTIGSTTLLANQYVEYLTKDGDLDDVGIWRYRAKLTFSASDIRKTNYEFFTVLA